jgi:hypothetical protein
MGKERYQSSVRKELMMRVALITTTIYVPSVLELYRTYDKEVMFFVVGDRKTPHSEAKSFIEGLGNAVYYSDKDQEKLGYRCSEIIGWNKIMRRNIALLEAIRHKADIIITIDDDNIPLYSNYFSQFRSILTSPFYGLMARSETGWFNIGGYISQHIYHRGFPYEHRHSDLGVKMVPVCNKRIGVAAGLWMGDPDIDAMERITNRPIVNKLSEILDAGVTIQHGCFSPFNSQNTAYIREAAPLMMVLVGVGRFDDIWGSYIAQRVMMETDLHVHFGKPIVYQERNTQSQWKNLADEMFGMQHTKRFCDDLSKAELSGSGITERLRSVYRRLRNAEYLPPIVCELGEAWCDDVEGVL